ncbi:MAG TPA: DUF5666 domain-containing protein [Fimbriimonas sp.]
MWLLSSAIAYAETQLVEASIAEINDRGFILKIGTEPLAVEDESATRFWKSKAPAKREAFKVGDLVKVRLKTDAAPTVVREMADRPTFAWLDKIRKEPMSGTVSKVDARYVTLKFADGAEFSYRATAKSDIAVGEAKTAADLKEGTKVYAKGRTLPTLDTWLVSLSDKPAAAASKSKETKKPKPKPLKLEKQGSIRGTVTGHVPIYRIFDVDRDGFRLHITYNDKTKFVRGGPGDIVVGARSDVSYYRDAFGRIIATKIELFKNSTQ